MFYLKFMYHFYKSGHLVQKDYFRYIKLGIHCFKKGHKKAYRRTKLLHTTSDEWY